MGDLQYVWVRDGTTLDPEYGNGVLDSRTLYKSQLTQHPNAAKEVELSHSTETTLPVTLQMTDLRANPFE